MSSFEIAIAAAMLVGLVGTVLPIVPGLGLIMGAGLVWALVGGQGALGWAVAIVMVVVGVAGMAIASALPARRTAAAGAPWWILVVGAIGVVVGFFAMPVVGALLGGPVAVFVAELIRLRRLGPAWRSTAEALKGQAVGIGVQLVAGVVMISLWAVAVLAG
jgi:uncharacterized protein